MNSTQQQRYEDSRRGSALIIIVIVMSMLALVVAGAVKPVRDEADLATLRVETTRAFYASESGAMIMMNAVLEKAPMPIEGDSISFSGQIIRFVQIPDDDGVVIVEGLSGDARRRIEFTTE
tara:strand:- start:428161 stop:428523 length:363 start_codon:yes stop_codon:yes gene_type:complete